MYSYGRYLTNNCYTGNMKILATKVLRKNTP